MCARNFAGETVAFINDCDNWLALRKRLRQLQRTIERVSARGNSSTDDINMRIEVANEVRDDVWV